MDRKPILVIYLEQMMLLQNIRPRMEEISKEYHVLILPGKENKCELFSGEKIEPIEIEDLKNILIDSPVLDR